MSEWKPLGRIEAECLWHAANAAAAAALSPATAAHVPGVDRYEWHNACMALRLEAARVGVVTPVGIDTLGVFLKVERQVVEAHRNRQFVEEAMKTYEAV